MSASAQAAGRREPAGGSGPGSASRWARRIRYYLPAVLVFVGGILAWELIVGGLGLQAFILPRPSAIVAALFENLNSTRFGLLASAQATLIEALGGLLIGTLAGVIVAFATARWATARGVLLPLAVAANAVPIIAFAPLMNNWFGLENPLSKMMMAATLVFFPVMANVTRGLVQVDPAAIELMRSTAASEWQILRKVRIPNALPYFFTAMKLATTLSLIGAIVGEYFGGSTRVLGRIIVESAAGLRFDITWAAILLAATTGIVFYLVIVGLERVLIPWHASQTDHRGDVRRTSEAAHDGVSFRERRSTNEDQIRSGPGGHGVGCVRGLFERRQPVRIGAGLGVGLRRGVRVGAGLGFGVRDHRAGGSVRPAPAPVDTAGPVRRLLRRRQAGLLRGRRADRRDGARRPDRRPAAGRVRG